MTKSDYAKGVTAGINLVKRHPSLRHRFHTTEHERRAAISKLEDKYRETIGEIPCPQTGQESYMRLSWYRDGIRDGIEYGHGIRFVVCHYQGTGAYNVATLAERTVYDNPAYAWKRSWELDPHGHLFTSKDVLYVNGACERFGLNEVYEL